MSATTTVCLICRAKCSTARNSIRIFNNNGGISLGRPLASIVAQLIDQPVKEDASRLQMICKKCYKVCQEVDELQNRVTRIKTEVLSNFKDDEDDEDEEMEEVEEDNKSNIVTVQSEVPKKILDIPSSDDDTANVAAVKTYQTIEDIELELVKIHGGGSEGDKDENQSFVTFNNSDDVVDSGAMEHSDSDYEGHDDTGDELLATQRALMDGVEVKLEPISEDGIHSSPDKPNILKKKTIMIGINGMEDKKEDDFSNIPIVERNGSLYTCLLCEGNETVVGDAKTITIHMRNEHGRRLYICDVCGQDFRKRNELSSHLDDHVAADEGDFQCETCNSIFNNLRLFRIHRRMHHPQNKAWTCDTCGKKYSSKNLLDEHVNTHLGVRPYICKQCGKDFASKYTYKAHEKTHEVRPRPFRCQQCPKSFLSHQNLTQHEKTHSGLKEFACHLCGKQFGSAHNLEVHSIVHTGYKPYVCGLCGKAFARKAEIRDHERTHTGERPYQCEMCGATFSQRSNLQSHKRATHYDDKRYSCDDCGKCFKRRRLLDYHIKAAHTGERPFKCDVCEATFVYPEHFKKHRRIHTGEKPFLCEVCGKAFNSRDNRNAHRFVHSDKKPYECLVCGAGFMRKPLLYQHMQAQGHLNDTIVVNQPRLTTDDDQMVTVNAAGEMEIVETHANDSKLYIADSEGHEHILIDGQHIKFTTASDDEEGGEPEIVDEIEQVVIGDDDDDYQEIITSDALATGETQIINTPDGPIQVVKVRIPNENGEEEETWIKIVPE